MDQIENVDQSDFEALTERVCQGLDGFQALQHLYDEVGWKIENPPSSKVRHILLHLARINAAIATPLERIEHLEQEGHEVDEGTVRSALTEARTAAKLLFHAGQIANLSGERLCDSLLKLYGSNAVKFAPDSPFATAASDNNAAHQSLDDKALHPARSVELG